MGLWDRFVDASWQAVGAMQNPAPRQAAPIAQMAPTQVMLRETAITTLNGSGNGTAKVGPLTARERWSPQNVHVSVSTNTNEAQCSIYVGDSPTQSNFRDQTLSGSTGDSSDRVNADVIGCGYYVFAVWTGGDPGSQAIMTVTGTKVI